MGPSPNDTGAVRPLPSPFDEIVAGRPARTGLTGPALLGSRLLTEDIAIAVAREAGTIDDPESAVDGAMWWPEYVPYLPARPAERRRFTET
jgi:hypothetical protein